MSGGQNENIVKLVMNKKLKPVLVNKAGEASQATERASVSRRQTYQGKHPSLQLRVRIKSSSYKQVKCPTSVYVYCNGKICKMCSVWMMDVKSWTKYKKPWK